MTGDYAVVVAAGSYREPAEGPDVRCFPHRWSAEGVSVRAEFTGAHLLHLAAAGCVLNDLYREADNLGLRLDGVRVQAGGDYDLDTWASTGIHYTVELDSPAPPAQQRQLLSLVDAVAEIPRAIRAGAPVHRR